MFKFGMNATVNINSHGEMLEKRGLEEGGPVQQALDSEVLHHCEPYVPMLSGVLRDSGPLSTEIGSGLVEYDTPYARKQYYKNNGGEGLAGRLWFERAKADHLGDWADVVEEISGGTVKLL